MIHSACKLVALAILVSSCNTDDPVFDAPINPDRIAFSATRQYPEGITYSPVLNKFLVSSITQGKVGTVDEQGRYADLITNDQQLISSIGMKVRGNQLYVCNGDQGVSTKSLAQTALKTAGLFVYDLVSGQNLRRVDLAALLPNVNHFANDITFDDQGNAYVTDSFAPVIYKVPADTTKPTILVNSPLFNGAQGFNLNGIVYHSDKFLIVVKSNEGKLFKVDLANANKISEITGVTLLNGDGMLLYNNDLYVVNNRKRVSQVRSTDGWKTAAIVKTDSVGYDQATTNVLVNNAIYSLNARIDDVGAAVAAKNPALLQANEYSIQKFK
ncbi:gluconolaconase [Spirosoma pollinicola]|uniref:Gluconolaconase n=1 Tax=Spirosoma pollinicola TaxID=2057025 RepID=A0A2K8Z4Q3_9BACT|nr:gluconolaconase [Spirosoma pollinicola]AUD04828.1 gluconolaconase [Spirosoma pollinicola]